ncbi:MAG: hypothetical protein V8T87_07350 [Victivallales bacterium]
MVSFENSEHYLERMVPWLKTLPDFLHASTHGPELLYYGTGESNHWPVQSNQNICAALAVMATHPELDSLTRSSAGKNCFRMHWLCSAIRFAHIKPAASQPPTGGSGVITGSASSGWSAWHMPSICWCHIWMRKTGNS